MNGFESTKLSPRLWVSLTGLGILMVLSVVFLGEWNAWLMSALMVLVFLVIFFLVRSIDKQTLLSTLWRQETIAMGVYLVAILAVSFFSTSRYESFSQWFVRVGYALLFFIGLLIGSSPRLSRLLLWLVTLTTFVVSFTSIGFAIIQDRLRIGGLLQNANALGGYLAIALPACVVLVFSLSPKFKKIFLIPLGFVLLTFLFSFSYTAWVSFILTAVIIIALTGKRSHGLIRRYALRGGLFIVLVIMLLITVRLMITRDIGKAVSLPTTISGESFKSSFSQRFRFNEVALRIFSDHPLTGSGPATYQQQYPRYTVTVFEQPRYVHNYYLEMLAESGVIGAAAYLGLILLLVRQCVLFLIRKRDRTDYWFVAVLIGSVLAGSIHSGLDFSLNLPSVAVTFWLIAGLVSSRCRGEEAVRMPQSRFSTPSLVIGAVLVGLILLRGVSLGLSAGYTDTAADAERDGRTEDAVTAYTSAFRFDPDPDHLRLAGWLLVDSKSSQDVDRALELARTAVRMDPDNYFTLELLGAAYLEKGDLRASQQSLELANTYDPWFHPGIQYNLAKTYQLEGKYADALGVLMRLLNAYPDLRGVVNPNISTELAQSAVLAGDLYKDKGNTGKAVELFSRALTYNPEYAPAKKALKELSAD